MKTRPIVVYDSGVGGLHLYQKIAKLYPYVEVVYFADSMHLPYGDKSIEQIRSYATNSLHWINTLCPRAVVIACNTISIVAEKECSDLLHCPVLHIAKYNAKQALQENGQHLLVLGTKRTIESNYFQKQLCNSKEAIFLACPTFVPTVENSLMDKEYVKEKVKERVGKYTGLHIDTIVLGCTHYIFLEPYLQVLFPRAKCVDGTELLLADLNKDIESNLESFPQKRLCFATGATAHLETFYHQIYDSSFSHSECISLDRNLQIENKL